MDIELAAQQLTDAEFTLIQQTFTASRGGYAVSAAFKDRVRPLIDIGLLEERGQVGPAGHIDLVVPDEVQQPLVRNGRRLRLR